MLNSIFNLTFALGSVGLLGLFPTLPTAAQVPPPLTGLPASASKATTVSFPFPTEKTIPLSKLSSKAKAAFEKIKTWNPSGSPDIITIVIYREESENYMFYIRGTQGYVFQTNPEIGGTESMPRGKIFTVNKSTLLGVLSKQDKASGEFFFTDGEYFERWVTPLIAIDRNGKPLPGQDIHMNYMIHSVPYSTSFLITKKDSNDLSKKGHGCGRTDIAVAKFLQQTMVQEFLPFKSKIKVFVLRWDAKMQTK
jgi:hypothetical protein